MRPAAWGEGPGSRTTAAAEYRIEGWSGRVQIRGFFVASQTGLFPFEEFGYTTIAWRADKYLEMDNAAGTT